jgi:hypothetical protein
MTTAFEKLYKFAEGVSSNEEMYMPQPFGDDPEHKSSMDPVNPEPLAITQPKEDGNQFTGSKKLADMSNTDENPSPGDVSAPKSVYKINVEDPPEQQLFGDAGETSRGDGSIIMASLTVNSESRKIVYAYIMENGQPYCSNCERYYLPKVLGPKMACTYCGCQRPNDDHESGSDNFTEGDVVDGDVIKTAPKEASKKLSNDSELYTRGFLDHSHGKPLDEDLAVLSDDYFNGYDQARYYGKTPLESVGAKPHKVTQPASPDGSLEGWEPIGGQDYRYDVDRSQIIASTLPTNVLEAFFNTEE